MTCIHTTTTIHHCTSQYITYHYHIHTTIYYTLLPYTHHYHLHIITTYTSLLHIYITTYPLYIPSHSPPHIHHTHYTHITHTSHIKYIHIDYRYTTYHTSCILIIICTHYYHLLRQRKKLNCTNINK